MIWKMPPALSVRPSARWRRCRWAVCLLDAAVVVCTPPAANEKAERADDDLDDAADIVDEAICPVEALSMRRSARCTQPSSSAAHVRQ